MKKLKLNIEELTVTSIETQATPDAAGTVYARSDFCTWSCSCWPYVCPIEFTRFDC